MTYLNSVKYISSAPAENKSEGGGMPALLERFGNPQRRIKYIRLAGSNGKTVCAEMLTAILGNAGYTVGCLRMPMREEPRENICIGAQSLSMDEFAELAAEVRRTVGELCTEYGANAVVPSISELLLTIALLAFHRHKCDLCIIESDHFGNDPSGVLPAPFAAVICGTIPSKDKAEIRKIRSYIVKGIQEIVSVPQNSEAYKVISDTCYSINCRLTLPKRAELTVDRLGLSGTEFSYKGKPYALKLCGQFQVSNAVLVLETAEMLSRRGFKISDEAIRTGLSTLRIPAKFEVIGLRPLIIADSTHTPVAIDIVCDALADFKVQSVTKVRLCLPSTELARHYVSALEKRGYTVESVLLPEGEPPLANTTFCKTKKALAKQSLALLTNDTILLISGDYPFVIPVRYELLMIMGF